jgi:hypothetical protein
MIYFLLILYLGDGVYIEAYPDRAGCEIRREQARVEHQVQGKCLRMETGLNV